MYTSNKTLLQILVEELPKLNPVPYAWNFVYQDWDKELRFDGEMSGIYPEQLASNHRCAKLYSDDPGFELVKVTRDQYEAALAASKELRHYQVSTEHYTPDVSAGKTVESTDSNVWIDWHGGECPVDSDAIVEVKFRKPSPLHFNNGRAGDFAWSHDGYSGDIIAYRLVHPHEFKTAVIDVQRDAVKPSDAQLEADLNDCIGQPQSNDDARDEILYELANFAATTKTSLDIGVATEIAIWLSGKGYRKQ